MKGERIYKKTKAFIESNENLNFCIDELRRDILTETQALYEWFLFIVGTDDEYMTLDSWKEFKKKYKIWSIKYEDNIAIVELPFTRKYILLVDYIAHVGVIVRVKDY